MVPDVRLRETVVAYRATFGKDDLGRQVLTWLLDRCGMFRRIETEEQRVLHNWGIELLENMGTVQGLNYRGLVDALLKFQIPDEALDAVTRPEGEGG